MPSPLTPFHARAKARAEEVLSEEQLRAKIERHRYAAERSLSLAIGMIRLNNQSFKIFTAAIAHAREGELAMDLAGDYARRLERAK